MKSSRILLLLAAAVMSTINADNNPDVAIVIEAPVSQQKQSLVHLLVLSCNDPAFVAKVNQELFSSQNSDGMTPADILGKQECQTDMCHWLKEYTEKAKQAKKELEEALVTTPDVTVAPVQE